MAKPRVVFCLGGPGCGKSTNCKRLEETYGYKHISAGDCLRDEMQSPKTEHAELIKSCIAGGSIVPVEITCDLLRQKMVATGWENGKFLIDGFPRNESNVEGWRKVMGETVDVDFLLFLDCPEEILIKRLTGRGKSSGRIDDNADSIAKRIRTYETETRDVIQSYKKNGKLRRIDSSLEKEVVWEQVKKVFE